MVPLWQLFARQEFWETQMVLWTSHYSVPQYHDSAGCLKHSCLPAWRDCVSMKELLCCNWISSNWWPVLTSISWDTSSLHEICLPLSAKKIARNEMLYSGFGNGYDSERKGPAGPGRQVRHSLGYSKWRGWEKTWPAVLFAYPDTLCSPHVICCHGALRRHRALIMLRLDL